MNKGIFFLSLKALKTHKVRSFLTTLGIIIGTAIVIIVLTIGSGVRKFVLEELNVMTPDMLWIEILIPSEGTRMQQNLETAQAMSSGVQITTMKIQDLEDIKKLDNIESGYAVTISQEKLTYENKEKISMIWAVGSGYFEEGGAFGFEIEEGRYFTEEEDKSLAQVVILGSEIKEKLFGNKDPINENVKIKQQNYKVIGVAKEIGTLATMEMDEIVYIPVQTTMKKIMGVDYVLAIGLKMKDKELLDQTVAQIETELRINHDIKHDKKNDFAVRTMDEAMDILNVATDAIAILLLAIALISLVVGGVGIMNVMFVAVSERTNEIGLKKAVGARPSAIKSQFMGEAIIIAVVGGIIGIIVGVALSWLMSFGAQLAGYNWKFVITINGLLFAFLIPAGIGIMFGYAPAKRASKMNPIDALKHT